MKWRPNKKVSQLKPQQLGSQSLSRTSETYEILWGFSHCMWIFFICVIFLFFVPVSNSQIDWIHYIQYFGYSAIIKHKFFIFIFTLPKVDLILYVNFYSCLWIHQVNSCQLTTPKGVWVNRCGWCLRPSHTAQNSRKRMNHAQNLVVRACPSRIRPFLLTYVMKNHRWIAQELRKDHTQITNKPRTLAHRHEKAPNRANAWLCVTNTRRKTTHNQRTVASELRMNRAWFTHELRKECAEVAFIPRI